MNIKVRNFDHQFLISHFHQVFILKITILRIYILGVYFGHTMIDYICDVKCAHMKCLPSACILYTNFDYG